MNKRIRDKFIGLLFFVVVLFLSPATLISQVPGYGNDWVSYDKEYYKFAISEDGIYRLMKSDLLAAGFSANELIGSSFTMYRNGEVVPLYVSTNGLFTSNDFIEFYGRKNRGEVDVYLYEGGEEFQATPSKSFYSDVSIHFLTIDPNSSVFIEEIPNNLTNLPAKQEYYLEEVIFTSNRFFGGRFRSVSGIRLFESFYQEATGYNYQIRRNRDLDLPFNSSHFYPTNDQLVTVNFRAFGEQSSLNAITGYLRLSLEDSSNEQLDMNTINGYNFYSKTYNSNVLKDGESSLRLLNKLSVNASIGEVQIIFPRKPIFDDRDFAKVNFDATGSTYSELEGLSGTELVVIDLSTNQRITQPVDVITPIRTSSSSQNQLVITTNPKVPVFVESIQFEDYSVQTGDVLVVTHPDLEQPINGENYVDKWVNHRTTENGGAFSVKKININQIIDQYGYGIPRNAMALKNFTNKLNDEGKLPSHLFIIGKGYETHVNREEELAFDFVPTFGYPASDTQLVSPYFISKPYCAVGRLAAKNTQELKNYVDKILEYEAYLNDTSDAVQTKDKLWMKNAMHLGGGQNQNESNLFKYYLDNFKNEYELPFTGGNVNQIIKSTTNVVENREYDIDSLINSGISLINYFGHSGPNSLEFNINDPYDYDNQGKYPFMITNGCLIGDIFQSDENFSERFVLAQERGFITFVGPTQFGIAQGMNSVCSYFYDFFTVEDYGITFGGAIYESLQQQSEQTFITRTTMQQIALHGDPTLFLYSHPKPDYLVSVEDVEFRPNRITAETENFEVDVIVSNIGKAIDEPILVRLSRQLPNGDVEYYDQTIPNVYYQDTLTFQIPTNGVISQGENTFSVEIDPDQVLDEITHANNQIGGFTRVITSKTLRPIYLNEFGITNDPNISLIASTQEFYSESQNFFFEIDTTQLFNSPSKVSDVISSNGGSISWTPGISMEDGQVYYWRTRADANLSEWITSSFIYLEDYEDGWNQSDYFQYDRDTFKQISQNEARDFVFDTYTTIIGANAGTFPVTDQYLISLSRDDVLLDQFSCTDLATTVIVGIFDGKTGEPHKNQRVTNRFGLYNSIWCGNAHDDVFYFSLETSELRKDFMDLFDQINDGDFVVIYSAKAFKPIEYNWAGDAAIYGETVWDKLEEQGATQSRNIGEETPYYFFFKKGDPNYSGTKDMVGPDGVDRILGQFEMVLPGELGEITSTLIGPAQEWDTFIYDWDSSLDNESEGDQLTYDILGVDTNGNETVLFSEQNLSELDLSSIDAAMYPYLRIRLHFTDEVNRTPPQLKFIRVLYKNLPELVINLKGQSLQDNLSLVVGRNVSFPFEITNISNQDMTDVLVRYQLKLGNGTTKTEEKRVGALAASQTLNLDYSILLNSNDYSGTNLLYIEANPDDDQPEQYSFNNVGVIEFAASKESQTPFLDVTFDGIRIINGDIVSDQPLIIISLTDENNILLLDNPDDFEIRVLAPGQNTFVTYTVDSPELTFFPATPGSDKGNTAYFEFRPNFIPGEHQLQVQGKDASGNFSGTNEYLIEFIVTDEDIITQIINYPNPFTTKTDFIAKIVGEIPDQMMIQIFAPTGKLVQELLPSVSDITPYQGNNFYKIATWDGTDQFGDVVGNGVYYYKITVKRAGEVVDFFDADEYSEYFHNGIGKLYIVR